MTKCDSNSQAVVFDELKRYSRLFVDEFLRKARFYPPPAVDLAFYPTQSAYQSEPKRSFSGPIYSEKQDNRLMIHICEESLRGIPLLALRGWLDQELTYRILERQPESYQFNFSRQILPLFPVRGSAANLIRHLVEYLNSGLKRYLAVEMIIDFGSGLSQAYFYFFKINPRPEEREDYQRIMPHSWLRALFLCQKLKEYMPLCLLANRDIAFSRDLKSNWLDHHAYLLLEDKTLLEELSILPDQHIKKPYSYKLIEIFKKVQSHLLIE